MPWPRMSPLPSIAAAALLLCLVCGTASAQVHSSPRPFSKDEIIKLLKGNVSGKRVGELAQERGIDFALTPDAEADLRRAGADDAFLATLRAIAAPALPTALAITSTPGGAKVYVDDEAAGTTSAQGRLKISTLTPGKHHLRLGLDGYFDREQDVEIVAGQTASLELALAPQKPPDVAPAAVTKPAEAIDPHLEDTSWHAVWWDPAKNKDGPDPDPKKNGYGTFSLGTGSLCTFPPRVVCSWKIEGSNFYMTFESVAKSKITYYAGEFTGKISGRVMEGSLFFFPNKSAQTIRHFRAQMDSGAPAPAADPKHPSH